MTPSSYKSKYFSRGSYTKRGGSHSGFDTTLNLPRPKNFSLERVPYYGALKHSPTFGSTSNLHKHSPSRESSVFNSRPHHWRSSKPFRNSPEDSFTVKERSKDTNVVSHTPSAYTEHPNSDFAIGDGFQKGDLVKSRYQIVQEIGRGSFGRVYKAVDNETGKFCAVKCIKDIANFRKLALEEISILSHLTQQDKNDEFNFLHLNDHFLTQYHIFMVSDLLSINLFQLIHRNNYRGFAPKLVRKFARCVLNCLYFLHE